MARNGGYQWLTAVKRAFSPATKNSGEKPEVDEEGRKKREKRRWGFRKSQSRELQVPVKPPPLPEKRYDNELAALKMAAEEAEVATTARVVVRFPRSPASLSREYYAAIIIQTVFRGYLARRALRALKGLVKLQALVRGTNVRQKTSMILQSMRALVRVQAKFSDERIRRFPAHVAAPWNGHKSSLSCVDNCWDSRSMSREGSIFAGDCRRRHRRLEQIQTTLNSRKDVALKREAADSYALSYQSRRSDCNLHHKEEEEAREMTWLDQWMASRTSFCNRSRGRASTDQTFSDATPIPRPSCSQHVFSSPLHPSPATPSPSIASHSPRLSAKTPSTPNYMAATESAMARVRSRSVPRQCPEKERPASARKRLSFPAPAAHSKNSLWSPRYGMLTTQRSNGSSSFTEGFGGETSPTSTADLRRWLR